MDPYDLYTALIGATHLLRLLDLYTRHLVRLLTRLTKRLPSVRLRLRWKRRRKAGRRKIRIMVRVTVS